MATDERKDADDAFGGYRGMWRSAEDDCRRLRGRAEAAEQQIAVQEANARQRATEAYRAHRRAEAAEQRVRDLEEQLQRAHDDVGNAAAEVDIEVSKVEAKLATAIEALRWYADSRNHVRISNQIGGPTTAGARARKALSQIEQGDGLDGDTTAEALNSRYKQGDAE